MICFCKLHFLKELVMQTADALTNTGYLVSAPTATKPDPADAPLPAGNAPTANLSRVAVRSLSALSAAALAACGGGSIDIGTGTGTATNTGNTPSGIGSNSESVNPQNNQNPSPTPNSNNSGSAPSITPPTETQAARFLMQAAFGGNYAQVQEVQAKGFEMWLDAEMDKPWREEDSHYNWIVNSGFLAAGKSSKLGMDNALWRKLMSAPDVLRQRIAFALSQIFVVSIEGLGAITWRNVAACAYMDLLEKNAFCNFADLLKAVSLSPAMGTYLNLKGSVKAAGNSAPDENFAREVMQLFTIGLYALNPDGSKKLQNGKPIETYNQADVSNLAALLTGWNFSSSDDPANLTYFKQPMAHNANLYTPGEKHYIGGSIASAVTGPVALDTVLEYLANHDNVGPFIGRQLIQRLVCSNPSPEYVGRVSAAFRKTVNGKRGNLKAVIKAVLLDAEARTLPGDGAGLAKYGKLREPALRLVQWARTFGAKTSTTAAPTVTNGWVGPWNIGDLSDDVTGLGQSPLRSPSVFNFYRPGYVPPQGDMGANGVTAPEFQICNEVTVAKYLNFMNVTIGSGRNDVKADYSADYPLAKNATALVDRYALLLAANALTDQSKKIITDAVTTQPADTDAGCLLRIKAAIFLIMATPEYMVQK